MKTLRRGLALFLVGCLGADPAIGQLRAQGSELREHISESCVLSSDLVVTQALAGRPGFVGRLLGHKPGKHSGILTERTPKPSIDPENPFKGLVPGGPRAIIGNRVFFIEKCGFVNIYWSQPKNFKSGDPVNVLNTGMSALELLRAFTLRLPGMSAVNKYWRPNGFATSLCESGAAVAQIVGTQSDLDSVSGKNVWEVAKERVTDPVKAIRAHHPDSPVRLFGLSTGAMLQACFLALGGEAQSAVWINSAFQFGEGGSRWLRVQGRLRRLLFRRFGGAEAFIDALVRDTSASESFLNELQTRFKERQEDPRQTKPPILFIATWTRAGIEAAWSIVPEWIAMFFGQHNSDGIVNFDLAYNRAPNGNPVVPWAHSHATGGLTHNQVQKDPAIQHVARIFTFEPHLAILLFKSDAPDASSPDRRPGEGSWAWFWRRLKEWRIEVLMHQLKRIVAEDEKDHPDRLKGEIRPAVRRILNPADRRTTAAVSDLLLLFAIHLFLEPILIIFSPWPYFAIFLDKHNFHFLYLGLFWFLFRPILITLPLLWKSDLSWNVKLKIVGFSFIPVIGILAGPFGLRKIEIHASAYITSAYLRDNGERLKHFFGHRWTQAAATAAVLGAMWHFGSRAAAWTMAHRWAAVGVLAGTAAISIAYWMFAVKGRSHVDTFLDQVPAIEPLPQKISNWLGNYHKALDALDAELRNLENPEDPAAQEFVIDRWRLKNFNLIWMINGQTLVILRHRALEVWYRKLEEYYGRISGATPVAGERQGRAAHAA